MSKPDPQTTPVPDVYHGDGNAINNGLPAGTCSREARTICESLHEDFCDGTIRTYGAWMHRAMVMVENALENAHNTGWQNALQRAAAIPEEMANACTDDSAVPYFDLKACEKQIRTIINQQRKP